MTYSGLSRIVLITTAGLAAHAVAGPVNLGSAESFAVLGGQTVTNTGLTVINGNLGVSPGTAVTGFPPGALNGTMHLNDGVALAAQNDITAAYDLLAGMASNESLTGMDLGGLTLAPGVYNFSSSAFLTGTLTLDAMGDPDAFWVFQMGSTLITASDSSVVTINGGDGCNVFWQVGSSATLGTGTDFLGNILALTSITLTTDASILGGGAFARNGSVTMDTNFIDTECALAVIPLPASGPLAGAGLILLGVRRRRTRRCA